MTSFSTPLHASAAIISTGDELITGQTLDSNSRWIAERLMNAGVLPVEHVTVPDDQALLVATLRRLAGRCDLIVMSGGLGPTDGDLTRPSLAAVLGEDLVVDDGAMEALRAHAAARSRPLTTRQERQAQRPRSGRCLPNAVGTAPGLHATMRISPAAAADRAVDIVCLPGPPGELRPMWASHVQPLLRPEPGRIIRTRLLHIAAMAESHAVERLGDMTRRTAQPLVGITASGGVLTLRIRFDGRMDAAGAERAVAETEAAARAALGAHVFGAGEDTLASAVLSVLRRRNLRLSTVESCTGGLVAKELTDVPGSSDVFVGGLVTYSNELKSLLAGVDAALIARHGAVSREAAEAMATGGRGRLNADVCVAVTGVAGPGGGSESKPVGTVWIAVASNSGAGSCALDVRRFQIPGDREDVRRRAAMSALAMIWFWLQRDAAPPAGILSHPPRLLWQAEPL